MMYAITLDIGDNLLRFLIESLVLATSWLNLRRTRELKPNGGNSIKDAIDRVEAHLGTNTHHRRDTEPPKPS